MIGQVTKAFVSAHDRTRVHSTSLRPRESRSLVADFNGAIPKGLTIQSATWEMEVAASILMQDAAIDGRKTSIRITASYRGAGVIRCQATLSNGDVYNQLFHIAVLPGPWFGDEAVVTGPTRLTVSV